MYEPGTIVNMRVEIIDMLTISNKDLPFGITKNMLKKIPEIIAVRVRMTGSKVTPGKIMIVHKSILSKLVP